jgi:soluble lytic murein transglycosylase-like protein
VKFKITQSAQYLELAFGLLLTAFFSQSTAAQIITIAPNGERAVYDGPVLSLPEGTRALPSNAAPAPEPVAASIHATALRHQLSPRLIEAVAWQESRLRQDAVSPKGARGIMQLMPGTARQLGVDAANPSANLDGGAAYLAQMLQRFDGDIIKALAAYNSGPDAVDRYRGVPPFPETRTYVDAVLSRLAAETNTLPEVPP